LMASSFLISGAMYARTSSASRVDLFDKFDTAKVRGKLVGNIL